MKNAKSEALKKRFETNKFAKKYKKSLTEREDSREMRREIKDIPSYLRRK